MHRICRGFSFSEPYIKLLADKRPRKREKFKLNGLREKPLALAGFILGVCHLRFTIHENKQRFVFRTKNK